MTDKQTFPMIAEKSWWMIREQFKKTIPSNVSVNYLKSLLSLTSDQAARNIISPLRQMGIVDEENKPTPRANDWRTDSQYSALCKKIVEEIYPTELKDLFPDPVVDTMMAKEWFKHTANLGESAATKVTSTFVLLKDGNIKQASDYQKKPSKTQQKKSIKTNTSSENATLETNESDSQTQSTVKNNTSPASPTLHIDMQIHISPEASFEQIDAIFASMSKHLYNK